MNIEVYKEITEKIINTLNKILDNLAISNPENYILFLINGEFNEILNQRKDLGYIPYTIDYRIDDYNDTNRLTFLCDFLNKYYSFNMNENIEFDFYRINIETMIYTHIWESKPFLKNLYRLTSLLKGEEYKWKVKDELFYVRANFLQDHIITPLSNIAYPISLIVTKGYERGLRNAFVHNDYSIDKERITYFNDRGKTIEERYLKMNISDWIICFVYFFSFSYWFSKIKMDRRRNLIKDFNSNKFWIKVPDSKGKIQKCLVATEDNGENFFFVLK